MKKHLVVLITIALIMNVCAWTGCGNGTLSASPAQASTSEQASTPGQESADAPSTSPVQDSTSAQASTPGQDSADASTTQPEQRTKPSLIIVEDESGDYRQAAQARKTASEDTGADKISPIATETSADGPTKVPEPGQNTANTQETANTGTPAAEKEYTVMVYVVGSNLESRLGAATNDFAEMTSAGLDHDRTNLVVYAGGCKRWVSNIPNTNNSVMDMRGDGSGKVAFTSSTGDGFLITAQTQEAADMGTNGRPLG